MKKLAIEKAVFQTLKQLPRQQYRQIVNAIFDLLADPAPRCSKCLHGSAYRRIAVGGHRVVYRSDETSVSIVVAGKPNDEDANKPMARKV